MNDCRGRELVKKILIITLVLCAFVFAGCTSNEVSREKGVRKHKEADPETARELLDQGLEIMYTDRATALEYFEEAAAMGDEDAIFLAGYMLDFEGNNYNHQDFVQARAYYEEVADDNPYACIALGYLYLQGQGVAIDKKLAKEYFDEGLKELDSSTIGKTKYPDVEYFILGATYFNGAIGSYNIPKALDYLHKSDDLGNPSSKSYLAISCLWGYEADGDEEKGIELLMEAADMGDTLAMRYLGEAYLDGVYVPHDYEKAIEWFEKAAGGGDYYSMYSLGEIYYYGSGVNADYELALKWLKKASNHGHILSMILLGQMYYDGEGVSGDISRTIYWWENAAKLGETDAMKKLGALYFEGDKVKQDKDEAYEWYKKAADMGDSAAQRFIDNNF